MTAEPTVARSRGLRAYDFASRFFVAHALAYPLAVVWAVASMPVAIHLSYARIEAMLAEPGQGTEAVGRFVVKLVAWPAGAAFALPHLAVLPFALGAGGARAKKAWWLAAGAIAAAGLLFGLASWIWLFTL